KLLGGADLPWQEWLNQTPVPSVQSAKNGLTMHYSFHVSLDPRLKNLIQTMLLANGVLRLAGARDILISELSKNKKPLPAMLGDYSSSLDRTGNFIILSANSKYKEGALKNAVIVVDFRESIMHVEVPQVKPPYKKGEKIRKFRELWIKGQHTQKRPKYSPAV